MTRDVMMSTSCASPFRRKNPMQAIRVTKTLDSETLYLPQLRPFMGQEVEIIVLPTATRAEMPSALDTTTNPLAGSVLRYDDPFEPAVPADEWEANQ